MCANVCVIRLQYDAGHLLCTHPNKHLQHACTQSYRTRVHIATTTTTSTDARRVSMRIGQRFDGANIFTARNGVLRRCLAVCRSDPIRLVSPTRVPPFPARPPNAKTNFRSIRTEKKTIGGTVKKDRGWIEQTLNCANNLYVHADGFPPPVHRSARKNG